MADMIASGLSWLAGQLKANCSQPVTVSNGTQSVVIQATLESQRLLVSDGQGNTSVQRPDADFVFTAADLDFGSGPVEPADGWTVTVAFGAVNKQFKLMRVNQGQEPSWRYTDPFQTMIRAHTKYMGNV